MATLHVGTYEKNGGKGLVPLELADGVLTAGEPFPAAPNASFGIKGKGLAYLVDERDDGALTVLRAGDEGWHRLASLPTRGRMPCHAALDRDRSRLAVANYASGSVALYALDSQGLPVDAPALSQARGHGPDPERQEGPHAHCVRFSHGGEGLYLVDLGADRIECLKLGMGALFIEATTAWKAPPGTGPRHLVFHPRRSLAVALGELASTLTLLEAGDGRLRALQAISTLPEGFNGESLGGHLELSADGSRIYVSNRGHDSIAIFSLENRHLELIQHISSGGEHPRHFVLLEEQGLLAAAHEKDGRITLFEVATDGTLTPKGEAVTVPGACWLLA